MLETPLFFVNLCMKHLYFVNLCTSRLFFRHFLFATFLLIVIACLGDLFFSSLYNYYITVYRNCVYEASLHFLSVLTEQYQEFRCSVFENAVTCDLQMLSTSVHTPFKSQAQRPICAI